MPAPKPAPAEPEQELPEHPGWSAPPEEWDEALPLLAPVQTPSKAEREVEVRGFAFLSLDQTFDEGADTSLARTGLDLEMENLFGYGGRLQLDVEAFSRIASLSGQSDEEDSRARLDRFSYLVGGDREDPTSWEVGRFLQRMMPEFGVLDGTEWSWRTGSGDVIGASVGFLPEPTPEAASGDDLQLAASWRRYVGEEDDLVVGLGVQKTWHEGDDDRDLVVGTFDWRPDDEISVHGSAWVDFYDSSEVVKSSGAELTEAHLSATKRFSGTGGVSLFATHLRFPDLLRNEFPTVTAQELDRFENTRFGLSAWRRVAEDVRLSGRADTWSDDEDDGHSGELRLGVRDRILKDGEVAAALFLADGKFTTVSGLRLTANRRVGRGYWTLGWESGLYEQDGFVGGQEELWQHVLRGTWDRPLGKDWDLSLWGDQRFGDEQEATTIGILLRRSF